MQTSISINSEWHQSTTHEHKRLKGFCRKADLIGGNYGLLDKQTNFDVLAFLKQTG
jgi:hypothetical protein